MKTNLWVVILAAGESQRFGSAKALAPWKDKTLLRQAVSTARAVASDNVLVVSGAYNFTAQQTESAACIRNPDWKEGMGGSLSFGLKDILRRHPAVEKMIVMTVDQPLVGTNHLEALLQASAQSGLCALTVADGIAGPPAVIPQSCFAMAMHLRGEKGLKFVLRDYEGVENAEALLDIDRPEDLARLRKANP